MDIVIKPTDTKIKAVYTIVVPIDPHTKNMWVEDEDMQKNFIEKYNIDHSTKQSFLPFMVISKSNERLSYWLKVAKKVGILREAKDQHLSTPFEIQDLEEQSARIVEATDSKYRAIAAVAALSHGKMIELSKLLGFDGKSVSVDTLKRQLYEICETTPSRVPDRNYEVVLKLLDDKDYNVKLLVAELIFSAVITGKDGKYMYKETYLGSSKEELLAWVKDKTNKDVVNSFKMMLKQDVE